MKEQFLISYGKTKKHRIETTQCGNSDKPQRPTNTRENLEQVAIEIMEKHLNAAGDHPECGANLCPTLMTASSPHQGKATKTYNIPSPHSLSLQTHSGQRTRREGLNPADFPASLHGFRQATSPLPRPKNESRNPPFQSKGQVTKGERPKLRGPGQTRRG